jgi:lysophospholipase L1-like esterase
MLSVDRPFDPRARKLATMPGVTEKIQNTDVRDFSADADMEERAYRDYTAMIQWARSHGIRIVFLAYPTEVGAFARANAAVRQATAEYGVPLVETKSAVQRVPEEERKFLWALHPNAAMYREIARDVAEKVLEVTGEG